MVPVLTALLGLQAHACPDQDGQDLRLLGSIVDLDHGFDRALIQAEHGKARWFVPGDTVVAGVLLLSVETDHVQLTAGDTETRLSLTHCGDQDMAVDSAESSGHGSGDNWVYLVPPNDDGQAILVSTVPQVAVQSSSNPTDESLEPSLQELEPGQSRVFNEPPAARAMVDLATAGMPFEPDPFTPLEPGQERHFGQPPADIQPLPNVEE
jgi:hypothetical protein